MRKYILISFCLVCISFSAYGQNESDALRYSTNSLVGTARSLALGGAYSAVGADLSAATLNPAGLGLYRRSDFSITPMVRFTSNDATYLEGGGSATDSYFGLSNLGIAINGKVYRGYGRNRQEVETGLKSYTFAFGYNQLQNYDRTSRATGFNTLSSISQTYADRANGFFPDNLDFSLPEGLGYNAFIIDTLVGGGGAQYIAAVDPEQFGGIEQRILQEEEGRKNEWFISGAANISDNLFIGLTVGIQSVNYTQNFRYTEVDVNNVHEFLIPDPDDPQNFNLLLDTESITYRDEFTTTGNGINARLGLIFRPSDVFRFGISFQSPTYLDLTEEYTQGVLHNVAGLNGTVALGDSLDGEGFFSDYNVTTPYVVTLGGMYLFGKRGFLTADVEITDYSSANLSSSADLNTNFTAENEAISELLDFAINYRLGAEVRIDVLRLRAGGALFSTAFKEEAEEYLSFPDLQLNSLNAYRRMLTFGLGIRQPNYYVDVSWVNQWQENKFSPFASENISIFQPTVLNTTTTNSVVLTIGFGF
ncbi:MAG: hypothetical protein AAF655_01085 [Bacteroidota bacterium]